MLTNVPDVLTVKETTKILNCGRTKLMKLIHENIIDAHFVCGKWLIFRTDLEEFILKS